MNYDFKNNKHLEALILSAFQEDGVNNDLTALSCINSDSVSVAEIKVKQQGIVCGTEIGNIIVNLFSNNLKLEWFVNDGTYINEQRIIGRLTGGSQEILSVERTLLNFIQRLSGVATLTNKFVAAIAGTQATILDTRKTIPGFRLLDKYAVTVGGGKNHRFGLYDMIMIKDNHIAANGSITGAVAKAVEYLKMKEVAVPIEVETKNLSEVQEALQLSQVQRIMFDNFDLQTMREGVKIVNNSKETEASGGVNLSTVRAIAETGVQYISVGAITHSAAALDISLDIDT